MAAKLQLKNSLPFLLILALVLCAGFVERGSAQQGNRPAWNAPHNTNPFIPGFYADASLLQVNGEAFLYATEDPWGTRTLGCWRSKDFIQWRSCTLNWPTKEAATSPTSKSNMVWAPSVVPGQDGHFYMYVSAGSEVWVGVADNPAGPWKNALGNRPLIPSTFNPSYHMIDAEAFLDSDGKVYLYWGSGLNWVNGHCFVVQLKPDMVNFEGKPRDITPPHYFEAPFMYKRNGRYYLMYSEGKTTDSTYKVRYALGNSPFGPFREGANSPILQSDPIRSILGPGHHLVFDRNGKTYIIYHRHSLPFDSREVKRQLCMDQLVIDSNGEIRKIIPTHTGPELLHSHRRDIGSLPARATASTFMDNDHRPELALDDNYATRWAPAENDHAPWIQLDFGKVRHISHTDILLEYPWKTYHVQLMTSLDGQHWSIAKDGKNKEVTGSPVVFVLHARARFIRLSFLSEQAGHGSLFEWLAYGEDHLMTRADD